MKINKKKEKIYRLTSGRYVLKYSFSNKYVSIDGIFTEFALLSHFIDGRVMASLSIISEGNL